MGFAKGIACIIFDLSMNEIIFKPLNSTEHEKEQNSRNWGYRNN